MDDIKSIYNHEESLFDVKEIMSLCTEFDATFEPIDVECNTSDQATQLTGKLRSIKLGKEIDNATAASLRDALFAAAKGRITVTFKENLVILSLIQNN
jgi:hypothetical protein